MLQEPNKRNIGNSNLELVSQYSKANDRISTGRINDTFKKSLLQICKSMKSCKNVAWLKIYRQDTKIRFFHKNSLKRRKFCLLKNAVCIRIESCVQCTMVLQDKHYTISTNVDACEKISIRHEVVRTDCHLRRLFQ